MSLAHPVSDAMSAPKLLAIVVGSTLLLGGVAAVSAAGSGEMSADNAPADAGPSAEAADQAVDANEQPAAEHEQSEQDDERADRAGNSSVGPSDGLPEQAPDHVSEIHETISSFLDGTISDFSDALQTVLGNGEQAADGGPVDESDADADDDGTDESGSDAAASVSAE
jgi:hypothetical protein